MTSSSKRISVSSDHDTPKVFETKRDMWSAMLDSVASGKRLPEKNIIMLGGTPESQRDFLENLAADEIKMVPGHQASKKPPTANNFALGYTYHDVLDADHEDTLARLSIFLLSDPSPSFTPLLQPLLTPKTIPNTLVVVLLDWSEPWFWIRQLQAWIQLLRTLLISLDSDSKEKMEETMTLWKDRGRGIRNIDGFNGSTTTDNDLNLPLGPGEWDEALGIPLCVVCQNSDRIEFLEKDRSWREEEFDFVLQFLRTILLKHGASLIYTAPSMTSSLQSLVHSSLGIHSLLKRQPLKHNVIDRDKILVPPNWDSWGKIRVLRDGFEVEAISRGWSLDIKEEITPISSSPDGNCNSVEDETLSKVSRTVSIYEKVIRDPSLDALQATAVDTTGHELELSSQETQEFLTAQLEALESQKLDAESLGVDGSHLTSGRQINNYGIDGDENYEEEAHVNEHIGPVQFNMGGIQVDADDILQRLKDRQSHVTPEPVTSNTQNLTSQNDALASFFEGLMHRGGTSNTSTPKAKPS